MQVPLRKIISGGQTGADQGGLRAADALGLETGGWAPPGYLTETGPDFILKHFGLKEHPFKGWAPRTEANVKGSDGTVIFGDASSPGSRLTARCCKTHGKPLFVWNQDSAFLAWLKENDIVTLNVAGNRESKRPGIEKETCEALIDVLKPIIE